MIDKVPHPYTTGNITVLYSLVPAGPTGRAV
jgi:hypothetical protein